jgi:hypothetical protein
VGNLNITMNGSLISFKNASSSVVVTAILPDVTTNTPYTTSPSPITPPKPAPSNVSDIIFQNCSRPWSLVRPRLLKVVWRLIYWTAFFLNWFILPVMQSYSEVGDFSTKQRIKSALKHRVAYYRNLLVVSTGAFIYYAVQFGIDPSKIIPICISISNTSGLIIMLPLLGYGLVDLPRKMYHKSLYKRRLDFLYYKVAKVNEDKCMAEQALDEALEQTQHAYNSIPESHPLSEYVHIILSKCPTDWREQVLLRGPSRSGSRSGYTEDELALLHQQVKKCMFDNDRSQRQWQSHIRKAIDWEDVRLNRESPNKVFQSSFQSMYKSERYSSVLYKKFIYTPSVQWWWKCYFQSRIMRCLTIVFSIFSAIIIWSEFTFVIRKEPLSIFELFYNLAASRHKYFFIELVSIITLVYMFSCTFVALFKIRLYDYFYLAPNQQTSESSLAMSGM